MDREFFETLFIEREKFIALSNRYFTNPMEIRKLSPFAKHKLTMVQINTVYYLHEKGDLTMGELAECNMIIKQSMTAPIMGLVRHGIVRRYQKNNNLKSVYVSLTDYGREIFEEDNRLRIDHMCREINEVATEDEQIYIYNAYKAFNDVVSRLQK